MHRLTVGLFSIDGEGVGTGPRILSLDDGPPSTIGRMRWRLGKYQQSTSAFVPKTGRTKASAVTGDANFDPCNNATLSASICTLA